MRVRNLNLDQQEAQAFRTTVTFLRGRLQESSTVEWALKLTADQRAQRAAVSALLAHPDALNFREPWKSAWSFIEDSWSTEVEGEEIGSEYGLRNRVSKGERGDSLVRAITSRVAPRLKIEPFSTFDLNFRTIPRRPTTVTDMFSVSMTSGKAVDPKTLRIPTITDVDFLFELATALDLAILSALAQVRRLGWTGDRSFWRLGGLNRVYFVGESDRPEKEHEPDEFNTGIAPSVKLLHSVILRLAETDCLKAQSLIGNWKRFPDVVHGRLWASLARTVASPPEIISFFESVSQQVFWDTGHYPEVAELRAKAFVDMSPEARLYIARRIKRGPPQSLWHRDVEPDVRQHYRRVAILRELRRIVLAGGELPPKIDDWFRRELDTLPAVREMRRVDDGFPGTAKAYSIPPNPDQKFDSLSGGDRLNALEKALRTSSARWSDEPAGRAADWIRGGGNPLKVLSDFETYGQAPDFGQVWDRFGWSHEPRDLSPSERKKQAARVVALVLRISHETLADAIDGLTWWLSNWSSCLQPKKQLLPVWRKLWPTAMQATNSSKPGEEEDIELTVETPVRARQVPDLDTLNNPAGRMVGVFLDTCPNLGQNPKPFGRGSVVSTMRRLLVQADKRSYLVTMHRLMESLPYFLRADRAWATEYLVSPLKQDNETALVLWHAFARRTHFAPVLRVIGSEVVTRALDRRLSRSTRESLIFSLVVECLHGLKDGRRIAVSTTDVQQLVRSVEDEVRAHAANVPQQFLREVPSQRGRSREELFDAAIAPFLRSIWPQERSLSTPGVSRAFADLPAVAGDRFAEAVDAVHRFLVPFDAWSSVEYGLYGTDDDRPKMDVVDTERKAGALLKLLDATIGTAEGSVVPHDLSEMLTHIRGLAPRLATDASFRRLATAARA